MLRNIVGPAAYDPNVKAIAEKGGKLVFKERRFRDPSKEDVPGPGTYEVRGNDDRNKFSVNPHFKIMNMARRPCHWRVTPEFCFS